MMTIEDEILSYLQVEPETPLKSSDLAALTGCTVVQIGDAMTRLKIKGHVETVGKTSGTRWRLVTP